MSHDKKPCINKYPVKNMISHEIMLQFQISEEKSHIKIHHFTIFNLLIGKISDHN